MKATVIACAAVGMALAGCAKNTKLIAQEKEYIPPESATPWKINGEFDEQERMVVISINQENIIRARFPPFTPHLSADAKYENRAVTAVCDFSSGVIAGKKNSSMELSLAEAIVSKTRKKGGNTCALKVDGADATTLYF